MGLVLGAGVGGSGGGVAGAALGDGDGDGDGDGGDAGPGGDGGPGEEPVWACDECPPPPDTITDWIRDRWLHCVNIVASDYFLGNDLIQLSIYANKMRALTRNVELTNKVISNQMQRQCKSMRKIEHLLDKSKIPPQFAFHDLDAALPGGDSQQNELFNHQSSHRFNQRNPLARGGGAPSRPSASSDHFITHINSNGRRILIEPLNQGSAGSSTNLRERRHSFVDNVSEGFSDLFSSFKRLLNL